MSKQSIAVIVAVLLSVAGGIFAIDFKSAVCGNQAAAENK